MGALQKTELRKQWRLDHVTGVAKTDILR